MIKSDTIIKHLIILQILDATCTYIGVVLFGLEIEGNPLVAYLMHNFTPAGGLFLIKSLAIGVLVSFIGVNFSKFTYYFIFFTYILYIFVVSTWLFFLFPHLF